MTARDVLRLLHRELGATPIDPTRYCPTCWTPTVPTRRGNIVNATLCRRCTNAELTAGGVPGPVTLRDPLPGS